MTRRMSHYSRGVHEYIEGICDATKCTPTDDMPVYPATASGDCPACLTRYEYGQPVVTIAGYDYHVGCAS